MLKNKVIRIIFIVAGLLLIADTVFVRTRSNWNLGVALPALLGAPLLLYGIGKPRLDVWFKQGFGRAVMWVFIGGYALLFAGTAIFSGMMVSAAHKTPDAGADAIIVLGAGIRGEEVTDTLQNRLDAAAAYYYENPEAILMVSGGYGQGSDVSEAFAMEQYLFSLGIPSEAIVKEDHSTSTSENFRYSKEILDSMLGQSYNIVYVTNDFHVLRAGLNAKSAGLCAQGLSSPTPLYILPNCYLRETFALFATYVFGTS